MKIWMVGQVIYDANQGDSPNISEFPDACFTSLEEAEAKYEVLAKYDKSWGLGYQEAYLTEVDTSCQSFTALKGRMGKKCVST